MRIVIQEVESESIQQLRESCAGRTTDRHARKLQNGDAEISQSIVVYFLMFVII